MDLEPLFSRQLPEHDTWYVGAKTYWHLRPVVDEVEHRLGVEIRHDPFVPNNGRAYLFHEGAWVSTIEFEGWEA